MAINRIKHDIESQFGRNLETGQLVHINSLNINTQKGLSCGCVCPNEECKAPLVAVLDVTDRSKYFRHHNPEGGDSCPDPDGTRSTIIHEFAVSVLSKQKELYLPVLSGFLPNYRGRKIEPYILYEKGLWAIRQVATEQWQSSGYRPDIVCEFDRGKLAIEVVVTHEVEAPTLAKMQKDKLHVLQIDYSSFHVPKSGELNLGVDAVLKATDSVSKTRWINLPLSKDERAALEAHKASEHKRVDDLIKEEERKKEERQAELKRQQNERSEEKYQYWKGFNERLYIKKLTEKFPDDVIFKAMNIPDLDRVRTFLNRMDDQLKSKLPSVHFRLLDTTLSKNYEQELQKALKSIIPEARTEAITDYVTNTPMGDDELRRCFSLGVDFDFIGHYQEREEDFWLYMEMEDRMDNILALIMIEAEKRWGLNIVKRPPSLNYQKFRR